MRKYFYCIALTACVSVCANSLKAQVVFANDSAYNTGKPMSGRIWGAAFGDYYFKGHADALSRGGNNQYSGIPQDRNAFQLRRIYLGYDFNFNKKFSAELLIAAEDNFPAGNPPASAAAGGDLTNGKLSFYIKWADLRWKNIWKGTDLVIGQQITPSFAMLNEKIWNYRSVERTMEDVRRTPAYDLGVGLQGTFDPTTKNFGYNIMVSNGTAQGSGPAKPAASGYKLFSGDVWAKFLNQKLIIDLYGDYNKLSPAPTDVSRNMWKAMVAYSSSPLTIGVDGFMNNFKNDLVATKIDGTTETLSNRPMGYSVYLHGDIIKNKLRFFARYDRYNPVNKVNNKLYISYSAPVAINGYNDNSYSSIASAAAPAVATGDITYKQSFFLAGLDFMPIKNIHIMPNVWYNHYATQLSDDLNNTINGNLANKAKGDYDLVYRITFALNFGR